MRTKKQLIACLLSFALLFGMIPASNVSAAKKVSLSAKKLTVTKGKRKTLKVKNTKKKVKWKILSGKKYISLKKKGKVAVSIKGKKKGKAKVRAVVGKKKLTCTVTVKNKNTDKKKKPTATPGQSKTTPTPDGNKTPTNTAAPTNTTTPPPVIDPNLDNAPEGANADDVKALKELIRIQKERGANVSEDMSDDSEYTWENGKTYPVIWM